MWEGHLYRKSLDAISSALDYILCPRTMQLKSQNANDKKLAREAQKAKANASLRGKRKHFKTTLSDLLDDLAAGLRSGNSEKAERCLALLDVKISKAPPPGIQQNRPKLDDTESNWVAGGITKNQDLISDEPTARDVKDLKGVFKMLIQSPAITEN
ncbi:hypothetical protein BGW38_010289, partial [Lunasporangiospora selenospora]